MLHWLEAAASAVPELSLRRFINGLPLNPLYSRKRRSSLEIGVSDVFILANNNPIFTQANFWFGAVTEWPTTVETISDPENCSVFLSLK